MMDGLSAGSSLRSVHESAHSHHHHRSYLSGSDPASSLHMTNSMPFMMPSYPMVVPGTQPGSGTVGSSSYHHHGSERSRMLPYMQDGIYKSSAYGSSSSRHSPSRSSGIPPPSPLSSAAFSDRSAAMASLSNPRGSSGGIHYPGAPYPGAASYPMDLMFPQYHEPQLSAPAPAPPAPAPAPPAPAPSKPTSSQPEPPKKPLSPYMRFSKSVWFQVKARNPQLSVCQLGATIGRMWRELTEEDKKRHLEDFNQDKVRYDNELKRYMKNTGLRAKDLKAIAKAQPKSKNRHRSSQSSSQQTSSASSAAAAAATAANTQLASPFMGLPLVSMPMGVGMSASMLGASAMSMLPHFSQVWTGQQYPGQPVSAAMMGIAGHLAQGLYSNGYATSPDSVMMAGMSASVANSALQSSKQALLSHDGQPLSMYSRYAQNYH